MRLVKLFLLTLLFAAVGQSSVVVVSKKDPMLACNSPAAQRMQPIHDLRSGTACDEKGNKHVVVAVTSSG